MRNTNVMKYELLKDKYIQVPHPITFEKVTLFQIRALITFTNKNPVTGEEFTVRKGDFGGYIAGEHNLSQQGTCWVTAKARMFDNAYRGEDSLALGTSQACENSTQGGYSRQMGKSLQSGYSIQTEFSQQIDYSWQSGNSIQKGFSIQKNRSKQMDNSIQKGNSTQMGFSNQTDHSIQDGHSTQTGHTVQSGNSQQKGNSKQADFSKQGDDSIQAGYSKQSGHSKQLGKSKQYGESKQYGYSVQTGEFIHSYGTHNTYSEEGELNEGTALGFIEFPPTGSLSMGMNIDLLTGRITMTTGYYYNANTKGYLAFEKFIKTAAASEVEVTKYLQMFTLLLNYKDRQLQG